MNQAPALEDSSPEMGPQCASSGMPSPVVILEGLTDLPRWVSPFPSEQKWGTHTPALQGWPPCTPSLLHTASLPSVSLSPGDWDKGMPFHMGLPTFISICMAHRACYVLV